MAQILIPNNGDFSSVSKLFVEAQQADADALAEAVDITFDEDSFLKVDGMAYLTAKCLNLAQAGTKISVGGDTNKVSYLNRMDFHTHLNLDQANLPRRPEHGRFLPIMLINSFNDVHGASSSICDLVVRQFDDAPRFIPAMEWAVNELIDNIVNHAESPVPGVVCAQFYKKINRLEVAICDMGRGIRESLATGHQINSHQHALEEALKRGVTRDQEVGQGNGLAGSLEICKANEADFLLWSGDARYTVKNGGDGVTSEIPGVKGTGLFLGMKTNRPVKLTDTFIAKASTIFDFIESTAQRLDEDKSGIDVAAECANTGTRPPGRYLRRKIVAILPEMEEALVLNFENVRSASSSFLDELLGRLADEFGSDVFKQKIQLAGMEETIRKMANVVIAQRTGELNLEEQNQTDNQGQAGEEPQATESANGWLIRTEADSANDLFSVELPYTSSLFSGIREGDGLAIQGADGEVIGFARLFRKRSAIEETLLYFDGITPLKTPTKPEDIGLAIGTGDEVALRQDWTAFEAALKTAAGINFDDLPRLKGDREPEQAYLRELLKLATVDDLLGPARGPEEEIVGMSVRDRYLVGKLAPRERGPEENIEGLAGASASPEESDEAPDDLVPLEEIGEGQKGKKASRRSLPGEEFNSAGGAKDIDSDDSEQVDASKNQSFVPSSVGLTACVAGDVEELELELNWGRYERTESAEQLKDNGNPKRAWKRRPSGGKIKLRLDEGPIKPVAPDAASPEVLVQGRIRPPLPTGDRLVTVFLVNNQVQPEQNQDEAWVFQPEIILRDAEGKSIFRRRPVYEPEGDDPERAERDALEMVYRRRVEFAVGHTISIQVKVADENVEQATEIRSSIMPEHEVEVTETPGLNLEDRPEMRRLIDEGHLDMKRLAEMEPEELVAALSIITNDYQAWIAEQRARIGHDVVGHDDAAKAAMDRCEEVLERLREGITTLKDNDKALEAFRFANLAMAHQRIRSIYSLKRRRGEEINVEDLDEPKNRSWRPFQLAFILLSIPAMADPTHRDRTRPVDAYADLLWFPTGGGKTEAYLGVAAFTMAIRRRQGDLGGLDSSRGLSVIMRYTLRLLTLQQFQRASTLICAMEVLRRKDEAKWGTEPFSIGLWVGMRVTPNTTEQSHDHITARRAKRLPKDSSPCQLTSCPWCGSEIRPERDIKVSRYKSGEGKTVLYCGDSHSVCDFSEANSPEWGIPAKVVDEEIYRRPPSMMIATVDKFALMAWKGAVRNLFGKANRECSRHGLSWPGDLDCNTAHNAAGGLPRATVEDITPIRPPDLIIQDEFHLISGPLGTMVGLYETVVDKLATWEIDGNAIRPKIIASTATARKAEEQINNVFMRKVSIFPPHGLDIEDNFFSAQRDIKQKAGRKYLGICSPGSARPAVLIRLYAALLTASQNLFEHFGKGADPWMTTVGYFNSLRELGGMKRLAEDDVQTRCYRVQMSDVARPGLAQRSARNVDELTSRVSSEDIPKILDALEIPFRADFDTAKGIYQSLWESEEARSMDVVLATNMLSVGVDINRLGLMAVNGQPKSTSEYIQATSRVGRSFPGLVCTVLTWSRPRDLSHYESFNHYHSTFYMHVEAQSVTPFTPRALDRGMMGVMVSQLRLNRENYTPNRGAGEMKNSGSPEAAEVVDILSERAWKVTDETEVKILSENMALERCDKWANEANRGGRDLGYEARPNSGLVPLLKKPGAHAWDKFTVPFSMREVEPGVRLVMEDGPIGEGPGWQHPPLPTNNGGGET